MTQTATGLVTDLDRLPWDHRVTEFLPGDPETSIDPRPVRGAVFTRLSPTPVPAPRTLAWSPEVAELLGLDPALRESDDFAQVFSGSRVPEGARPYATAYGGHQFGNWAGQLGDGRAIALGEVRDVNGHIQSLQLKGAGRTPYSRGADGRAVLRSSLREFLASEALHHLGIPTTRALSLVLTGHDVVRDVLYDGNPEPEPGAVVCRVAPSFTRFGHFQLPTSRNEIDLLRSITEFTIREDYPGHSIDRIDRWFAEVADRTMALALDWMRVGFVHGVLNTDNLSILGLTIDYGPYGWLEGYDPNWTPNTTDASGRRYRFDAQPQVAFWNLVQLANALVPLAGATEPLEQVLDDVREGFADRWVAMQADRLGWGAPRDGDGELVQRWQDTLTLTETDYVIVHRRLADVPVRADASDDDLLEPIMPAFYAPDQVVGDVRDAFVGWLRDWAARARLDGADDERRAECIRARSPRYVLRNWLAQEAIDAATEGDTGPLHDLLDVLRRPYEDQAGRDRFDQRRPEWARVRVGCSMLSCSS